MKFNRLLDLLTMILISSTCLARQRSDKLSFPLLTRAQQTTYAAFFQDPTKRNAKTKIPTTASKKQEQASKSSFPLIASQSYRFNARFLTSKELDALTKAKLCQTDLQNRARTALPLHRELAHEALSACGHPCPALVMVVQEPTSGNATAGCSKDHCRTITIDPSDFAKITIGTARMIFHHEATHLTRKDYYYISNNTISRKMERIADESCLLGKCCQCAKEITLWYFARHNNNPHLAWKRKYPNTTYENIIKTTDSVLTNLILQAYNFSEQKNGTHPIDIERALRYCRYRRMLDGQICRYHSLSNKSMVINSRKN